MLQEHSKTQEGRLPFQDVPSKEGNSIGRSNIVETFRPLPEHQPKEPRVERRVFEIPDTTLLRQQPLYHSKPLTAVSSPNHVITPTFNSGPAISFNQQVNPEVHSANRKWAPLTTVPQSEQLRTAAPVAVSFTAPTNIVERSRTQVLGVPQISQIAPQVSPQVPQLRLTSSSLPAVNGAHLPSFKEVMARIQGSTQESIQVQERPSPIHFSDTSATFFTAVNPKDSREENVTREQNILAETQFIPPVSHETIRTVEVPSSSQKLIHLEGKEKGLRKSTTRELEEGDSSSNVNSTMTTKGMAVEREDLPEQELPKQE